MSYIGQQLPADVFSGFVTDSFTGDGSATTFTLSKEPFSEDTLIVVINNVIQKPTTNFTVSGTTLTIVGTAVASGDVIYAIHTGGPLPIGGASELDLNGASDKLILDADGDTTISADTDDQIDIKIGGSDKVSITSSQAKFTQTGDTDVFVIESTSATAETSPDLVLFRNSSSPADADTGGNLIFRGRNDNSQDVDYNSVTAACVDVSDGSESGRLEFATIVAGNSREMMRFQSIGSAGSDTAEVAINEGSADINFRCESNGNDSMLKVDAGNDRVGVGTGSPATTFHVDAGEHNNTAVEFRHTGDGSSNYPYGLAIRFQNSNRDNNTEYFILCIDSSGSKFRVDSDGDVKNHDNSYGSTSDERIKEGIRDANSQWDDIKAVKVRNFKQKSDIEQYGDKAWEQIGVIAQELEDAGMDKLVKDEVLDEDGNITEYKSVKYSILYMKAIKALQEAMAKIETLETKVKALEEA